ncbi:hypothetical protein [Dactylosporangium sp. NPDC005555]|uniref:LppU/SCO3897 family protein n=1 Tax=Dactylosporangium sp. NPDC005555 TaxID=3154889 RepID=UPI0033B2C548
MALVIILVLLLCGGGAAGIWYVLKDNKSTPTTTSPTTKASTSAKPSTSAAPSTAPSGGASSPAGVSPGDAKNVKVGECLTNIGSATAPVMQKTACGAGTFEVLKKYEGTSDKEKCNGVTGYTHNYFYKATPETFSFVLCMKLRS